MGLDPVHSLGYGYKAPPS